jgi:peptidoglycan/LPS O-acetylase OafA/YrhL
MGAEQAGKKPVWARLLAPRTVQKQTVAVTAGDGARIDQLTGLRFFAALLVFISHFKWENSWGIVGKMAEQGSIGVSFFFVLSGFVISYSYGWRLRSGDISRAKYFALRFARLWPLHFLTGLPFAAFLVWKGWLSLPNYGVNLLFLQSWVPSTDWHYAYNGPSWSLSNEMFFYAAFMGLVMLGSRQKLWLYGGLVVIVAAAMALVYTYIPNLNVGGNLPLAEWMFYIFPLFRLDEFLLGMIIFDLWRSGKFRASALSYVTIPLLLAAMYFGTRFVAEPLLYHLYYSAFLALLLVSFLDGTSRPIRFFSSRIAVLLGEASFAFYLIHKPLVDIGEKARHKFGLFPSDLVFVIVMLALCIAVGLATHLLIEKPVGRFLRQRINRMKFLNRA